MRTFTKRRIHWNDKNWMTFVYSLKVKYPKIEDFINDKGNRMREVLKAQERSLPKELHHTASSLSSFNPAKPTRRFIKLMEVYKHLEEIEKSKIKTEVKKIEGPFKELPLMPKTFLEDLLFNRPSFASSFPQPPHPQMYPPRQQPIPPAALKEHIRQSEYKGFYADSMHKPSYPTSPVPMFNHDLRQHIVSAVQVASVEVFGSIKAHFDQQIQREVDQLYQQAVATFANPTYVEQRVKQVIAERLATMPVTKAEKPKEPKKDRKNVVILGLIGAQANLVRETVGSDLNVTFLASDVPVQQMRSTCRSADYTFAMVKFISHKHTDALKADNPSALRYVNGGITELVNKLAEVC